jgi:L-seryl-tRNA(Ser) seleniumtransferase
MWHSGRPHLRKYNVPRVKAASKADLYQKLPSVDELVRGGELAALVSRVGQSAVTDSARTVLVRLREEIASGQLDDPGVDLAVAGLPGAIERQVQRALAYSLRPVINATGVILHTNLGRAPLAATAPEHIREVAGGYSNLEFDLASGERGKRDAHVDRLFERLLGEYAGAAALEALSRGRSPAIATIVVNNNAAAVLLALNTLGEGGEVIVSRGELVEIGASFRIPDVMLKSHALLREVGTTNRTRIEDYERAINEGTRVLLRVHRSNFEITGFTERAAVAELVELARKRNIPLVEDLGSGALFDLSSVGVKGEPGVLDSLHSGIDVVTYSGDKLLGGPQAGLLSGRADLINRMRSNPLFRALRADKLTYAALEATLLAYAKRDHDAIPVLRMMRLTKAAIGGRAQAIAQQLQSPRLSVEVVDGESVIGGGAAPSAVLPTSLLALRHQDFSADQLLAQLRSSDPPIIARVEEDRVLLDLRTVFPEQDHWLSAALGRLGERSVTDISHRRETGK